MNFAKCRSEQRGGESSRASGSWRRIPTALTTLPHAPFPSLHRQGRPTRPPIADPDAIYGTQFPILPGEPHTTVEQVLAEEKKRPQGEARKPIARRAA